MDVFLFYAAGTAGWMGLQGTTLLASPTLISTLCNNEPTSPTELESYLCRSLGMAVITIGVLCVLLTGSVPLTSSMRARSGNGDGTTSSPYHVPTLMITLVYHALTAFLMYARALSMSSTFYAGSAISGILAVIGAWCALFATSGGMINRESVLDEEGKKKTSGFPFKNEVRNEAKNK